MPRLPSGIHDWFCYLVGLSKERPILDHHAKAHIPWNPADFKWISWNPADFRWNPADFVWISYGFHTDLTGEIRRISKDQLPGMVSPMFFKVPADFSYTCIVLLFTPQSTGSRPRFATHVLFCYFSCFTPQYTSSGLSADLLTTSIMDIIWQLGKFNRLLNWIWKYLD